MTKILDNQYFTTAVPKIMELRKGFLINGQYHLKENMQPVPFNFVSAVDANEVGTGSYTQLNRTVDHSIVSGLSLFESYDRLLIDSQNEDVCYVICTGGTYTRIYRFEEKNNRCTRTHVYTIGTSNNITVFGLKELNEENAIEVMRGGVTYATDVVVLKKENLEIIRTYKVDGASVTSSSPDSNSLIEKDFYYKAAYYSGVYFSYYCRNLNTYRALVITDPNNTTNSSKHRVFYNNTYRSDESNVSVLYPMTSKATTCEISKMVEVNFDKNTNEFTKKEYDVTKAEGIAADYYKASESWGTDLWHKTIGGKDYVFLYLRFNNGQRESKFITFERKTLEDVTTYEVIKIQDFPLGQSGDIITFRDDNKIKFYGSSRSTTAANSLFSSVYCYELDELKLEMVKTFNQDGLIRDFGFDKDRNLYITWSDLSVSRHNERTVANFNARFEEGLYEYQGEDIVTNLIISTTNLEGAMLAREVMLDIKGNAKFTTDGSKNITVTTLTESELKIPVTITGAGSLNIFPKIKA